LRDEGVLQPATEETQGRFDDDSMWKDIIERYFYPLLERTVPSLYGEADIGKPPRYLDKEFRDILNTSEPGIHNSPHRADFLIDVPLKGGQTKWVLFHVEVQGQGGSDLSERMFHYLCLIYAHYRRETVALALITNRRPADEPDHYEFKRYGIDLVYRYNRLEVAGLSERELLGSGNPIDLVLAAAKHALAFPKDDTQKFRYLKKLARLLSERNWNPKDTRDLAIFLERVTRLKDQRLKAEWVEVQKDLNKEGKVVYVSLLEQHLRQEITQEVTQELTDQVTQQVTDQVTQQVTDQVTQQVTDQVRQQVTDQVTHDVLMKLLALNYPMNDIAEITGLSEDEIRAMTR